MPPLRRSSLLMLGGVEPNLTRPSGSSPRDLPASVLPTPPALAFGGFRFCLAEQGSEFFQQPMSFILIGCALQLFSQSVEACDDFFERSLSDHWKIENIKDVRISSIIGYPTSCTTFVPLPSPMNVRAALQGCDFLPAFSFAHLARCAAETAQPTRGCWHGRSIRYGGGKKAPISGAIE
jgi:hypothetical protein